MRDCEDGGEERESYGLHPWIGYECHGDGGGNADEELKMAVVLQTK